MVIKKYIIYKTYDDNNNILDIGGLGHSFTDYLTPLIISKIFENIRFINTKLETSLQQRDFDIINDNNKYYWNDFLNLNYFNKEIIYNDNNIKYLEITNSYSNVDINLLKDIINEDIINEDIINEDIINEDIINRDIIDEDIINEDIIIYCLKNNNRIYLFDLYNYELSGIIKKNTTKNIINELRNAYFLKHNLEKYDKKVINIYIRKGDLYKVMINKNLDKDYFDFEFILFNYIYNILSNKYNFEDKYIINIISAGSQSEMNEIMNNYINYKNINFIFNKSEDYVFKLMIQSDILIFTSSSFPFTASLYSDGIIIKKKKDYYFDEVIKFKDIQFLDNYIFIDTLNDLEQLNKINNLLEIF